MEEFQASQPIYPKEKKATLLKLHRLFGHPRLVMMAWLLEKVKCADREANIHE